MTPVLAGVAAVVAIVIVFWFVAGGARLIRRKYLRLRGRLRRAVKGAPRPQAVDLAERDWIYSDRPARSAPQTSVAPAGDEAVEDVGPPELSTGLDPRAATILRHAEAEAAAIVKQAEQKAREILAAAEAGRAELDREAARQRSLAAEERTKLTAFLSDVLDEVQRGGVAAHVRDLSRLRELKDQASGND